MDLDIRRKSEIKEELELEIQRKVREALDTPPAERIRRQIEFASKQNRNKYNGVDLNAHINFGDRDRSIMNRRLAELTSKSHEPVGKKVSLNLIDLQTTKDECKEKFEYWLKPRFEIQNKTAIGSSIIDKLNEYGDDTDSEINGLDYQSKRDKELYFSSFTKFGFFEAIKKGRLPDGSILEKLENDQYRDKFGIIRDLNGPFWPKLMGPLHPTPVHKRLTVACQEPLVDPLTEKINSENENLINKKYDTKWKYAQVVYDSDSSPRDIKPQEIKDKSAPCLIFESRFECGNLRQARRVGQFEYELILRNDLYTKRHTQWFYFRLSNMVKGATYKFFIINLLKQTSLYMQGMRILMYSEKKSDLENYGWYRNGHHIRYSRNVYRLQSKLLNREFAHFQLEFEIEFPYDDDTCYFSHCYPYTFTDLKHDVNEAYELSPDRFSKEILCETKLGNSCFLMKCTDNKESSEDKFAAVITARVHPGETNASWMMKGFINYLQSDDEIIKELLRRVVFYIIPMLNPDGVIVGNYRCSMAARDLNRNYRNPRPDNFPTVYYTKKLVESLKEGNKNVVLYCDLHGHSRKHNVFMYGCDSQYRQSEDLNCVRPVLNLNTIKEFIKDRIFPWLMQKQNPSMFSFGGCQFKIRRCKISTGRVVMWKQFNIENSYTLESTFSGSNSTKIHFSTRDLETIGVSLSNALLVYINSIEDEKLEKEIGLEVLKAVLKQMAAKNNLVESILRKKAISKIQDLDAEKVSSKSAPNENTLLVQGDKSIDSIIDDLMDDDLNCLIDLNLSCDDVESESSSDSDSESEPEETICSSESPSKQIKPKKKKRKIKSQYRFSNSYKNLKTIPKLKPKGLPAIDKPEKSRTFLEHTNFDRVIEEGNVDASNERGLKLPLFVSKYEGRKNGGIPCFAEERLIERARKKSIASLKKEMEGFYKRYSETFTITSDDNLEDTDEERFPEEANKEVKEEEEINPSESLNYSDSLEILYKKHFTNLPKTRLIPKPMFRNNLLKNSNNGISQFKYRNMKDYNPISIPRDNNKMETIILTNGSIVTVKQENFHK